MTGDASNIRTEHLAHTAVVYVRQSSLHQVRHHLESQRRQYAFADQATALGWSPERVVIIDEDQGKSGAVPKARAGFAKLVGAVARGEVGIVMSLELSRLSRNDADWNHLVFLCRWTNAPIADEQGLYDPSAGADRMVLGLRRQDLDPTGSLVDDFRIVEADRMIHVLNAPSRAATAAALSIGNLIADMAARRFDLA